MRDGIACVYSPHTTCCIRITEPHNGFLDSFVDLLRQLVPHDGYYAHDDWDKRTENICPEDVEFAQRPLPLHGDAARHRRRVDPYPRR